MNLLIVENNFLLKENFFLQSDLKNKFNLIFSSSIKNVKTNLKNKKFDFIIISSLSPKMKIPRLKLFLVLMYHHHFLVLQ